MTFAELMAAANESKTGRNPGEWTPGACKIWRETDPEDALLLEVARDCRVIGGQAAIAVSSPGLVSNSCPKPGLNLPLKTAQRT